MFPRPQSDQQGDELDFKSSNAGQVISGSWAVCQALGVGVEDESHGLGTLKVSLVENCLIEHTVPLWDWS